ncbi:MAG: UMP kinase [Nanoarchaeota archaeon]|nr:UMP kinase [Nanoarchaeota archaeon]MBU1027502.1 UMP kinase [Nanoarchaeota archaeon]
MKKQVIVLSLGGSLIIPNKIDLKFLNNFKKTIKSNLKNYKFIIVCGGGSIARTYISALKNKQNKIQSTAGIASTRTNAKFMSLFFDQDPLHKIPQKLKKIKKQIKKQEIIFCGALDFKPKQTTDSNAAEIASYFKTDFINLTNVLGLYDKNPKKFKNAKFIEKITWKSFYKTANKLGFKPGQHFVLDQTSAKIILKNKIKTYILGQNMNNLDNLLKNKSFKGTIIEG